MLVDFDQLTGIAYYKQTRIVSMRSGIHLEKRIQVDRNRSSGFDRFVPKESE